MPLYMLWGDEDFNIELRLNEIKSDVLKGDINPLNYRRYDNPSFGVFDEILRTQGLMFGNILNVIHAEKYFLNVSKKIELDESQINTLMQDFETLSGSNYVVLLCFTSREKQNKPDSRKKIYKALEKYGKIEHFEALKPYQTYKAVEWLNMRAKKRKLEINPKLTEKLVEISGVNLRNLDSELDKLELMAYPDKKITESMIKNVCSNSQNIYYLIDLILEKKYGAALDEISKIVENSHFLPILSFLQATFNNLLYTKIYSNDMTAYEIARKIGQSEFIVKQNMSKIKSVDLPELLKIKQNLIEAEYKLKTGTMQDPMLAFSYAFLGGEKNA